MCKIRQQCGGGRDHLGIPGVLVFELGLEKENKELTKVKNKRMDIPGKGHCTKSQRHETKVSL